MLNCRYSEWKSIVTRLLSRSIVAQSPETANGSALFYDTRNRVFLYINQPPLHLENHLTSPAPSTLPRLAHAEISLFLCSFDSLTNNSYLSLSQCSVAVLTTFDFRPPSCSVTCSLFGELWHGLFLSHSMCSSYGSWS